jgi:hypothetical protein
MIYDGGIKRMEWFTWVCVRLDVYTWNYGNGVGMNVDKKRIK